MTQRSSIAKIIAVTSSLALLGAYVWHSHITPNTPPPDPLGLSTIELIAEPADIEFNPPAQPRSDLRLIGSKSINQPIFSVRKWRPWGPVLSGSKSGTIELSPNVFLPNEDFDLFGEHKPSAPPP